MYQVKLWNDSDTEEHDIVEETCIESQPEVEQSDFKHRLTLFKSKVEKSGVWLPIFHSKEEKKVFVIVLSQIQSQVPHKENKDSKVDLEPTHHFQLYRGGNNDESVKAFRILRDFFSLLATEGTPCYSLEILKELIVESGPVHTKDLPGILAAFDVPGPLNHPDVQPHLQTPDEEGNSLLHLAARFGSWRVIRALLEPRDSVDGSLGKTKSKFLNSTNGEGDNPLIIATRQGHLTALLLLLRGDSDPNFQILQTGNTALHIAATSGFPLLLKCLVLFDADWHIKNKEGKTALDCALGVPDGSVTKNIKECVAILQELQSLEQNKQPFEKELPNSAHPHPAPLLLCLDGGGIRGLIEAVILSELESVMKEICPSVTNLVDYFDFTAGTSTGSFIVAYLVYLKHPPSALKKLYFHFKDAIFSHSKKPIQAALTDKVAKEAFGELHVLADEKSPMVMIATTIADVDPPIQHLMCNYGDPKDNQKGPEERKLWEACRASSAAPTYFTPFEDRFIDGGVIANNPTLDAMTQALKNQADRKLPLQLGLVLSLGTGISKSESLKITSIPHINWWNPADIWKAIQGAVGFLQLMVAEITASNGVVVERAKTWCKSMDCPYFRLSPPIASVQIDETDDKILIEMMYSALIYARKNRPIFQEIAQILVSRKK